MNDYGCGDLYREFDRSWDDVNMPMLPTWLAMFSAFVDSPSAAAVPLIWDDRVIGVD
jgi:hypothetical protein